MSGAKMTERYAADLAKLVETYLVSKREKPPQIEILEKLFETLFFASLRREETQLTTCRIAFISRRDPDPEPPSGVVADRWKYFALSQDLSFNVSSLVKLSQAVDPWGSTLAVDTDSQDRLRIWGLIDQSVHFSTYLMKENSVGPEMPGMFQAAINGIGEISAYKTYVLIGSLKHDSLISRQRRVFQAGPVYRKLMPWVLQYQQKVIKKSDRAAYESRDDWDDSLEELWISTLCRLLIQIQRYGHGGTVLISDHREHLSAKYSLKYSRLQDALVRLGILEMSKTFYTDQIMDKCVEHHIDVPIDLYLDESIASGYQQDTSNELTGCIRFLTSLSRVDGLLWLDSNLSLRAFGVEITIKDDPPKVFKAENSEGTKRSELNPSEFGMRHRSMIRYCNSNPDAVGFVISQDGDVRAVTKVDDAVMLWDRLRIQSIRMPVSTSHSKHSKKKKKKKRKKRN
jgi:hypothetical protein